jgi:TatD DNase family protein
MKFFDTHCHLQDERFKDDAERIIRQAISDGVAFFVCCGSSESDWENVADLARTWKQIIPAFGIHPWYIKGRSSLWKEHLRSYLDEFPEAAVGEIGLDHLHATNNHKDQIDLFIQQLEIAAELNRTVSVHCLKAWEDLVSAISLVSKSNVSVVLHSYSGSLEMVRVLERIGCYFSYSGAVTYSNNKRICNTAQSVNAGRLLLETDSPDIPPMGHHGRTEPSVILQINKAVASLRGIDEQEMAAIAYQNAITCFKGGNG